MTQCTVRNGLHQVIITRNNRQSEDGLATPYIKYQFNKQ